MKKLIALFVSFFKVGILTIGGGYAMLPMLKREVVERRSWVTEEDILDCYAIGQCTPGVIAVNTATFVGFRQGGFWGAAAATFGVVAPSVLIITVLAGILNRFSHLEVVQNAFAGIRVAVCVLIGTTMVRLWKKGVKGGFGVMCWLAALLLAVLLKVSSLWIVVGALLLGLGKAAWEAKK